MKRLALALVPAVLLALAPAAPAVAGPGDRSGRHGSPVLLALGDSVAFGVGATPGVTGYPDQVQDLLALGYNPRADKVTGRQRTSFELVNLAQPAGGTSLTLLTAQLPTALALIESRRADRDPRNDVEVITVTIGGNDLFTPVILACLPPLPGQPPRVPAASPALCSATTTRQLLQVSTALTSALTQLTAAAGRRAEVVVTTYYNPVRTCPLGVALPVAGTLAEVVLEGGTVPGLLTVQDGLNDVIRSAAAARGAQVAELHGELGPDELVGDCLHPDLEGHTVIADIVAGTLAR